MKFEEFVKNNLNPELFGGKRLTIDACMYLLVKQYVILKKDSVVKLISHALLELLFNDMYSFFNN